MDRKEAKRAKATRLAAVDVVSESLSMSALDCLLSLGYRSNRVITLGVSSVFLFALGVYFVGSWRRSGVADVNW